MQPYALKITVFIVPTRSFQPKEGAVVMMKQPEEGCSLSFDYEVRQKMM
jgi:hypothetical protein